MTNFDSPFFKSLKFNYYMCVGVEYVLSIYLYTDHSWTLAVFFGVKK